MPEANALRSDVAVFLEGSPAFESSLIALSAAESLTDELALYLVELTDFERPSNLINALHVCDFVVERNSEWNLAPSVRDYLLDKLSGHPELFKAVHGRLLRVSRSPEVRSAFSEVPRYLVEGPGEAYHASALDPSAGLPKYGALAVSGQRGQQWLGARLAREQQTLGILPPQSLEVDFLQGMVYYREGDIEEAEPILRSVSEVGADRIEVAIALHIVGRLDGRRGRTRLAETELKHSLEIRERLGDKYGEAQVLHTLGQLIGRNRSRTGEAEGLLRQSITLRRELRDKHGEAQVLHTLGQLIGRNRSRTGEAEGLLRQSITLHREVRDKHGEAQVLHTLGQLIGRNRSRTGEAEGLLRQSITLLGEVRDKHGEAQVLHTLGQLIGRNRSRTGEAEGLLRQSITLLGEVRDKHGEAQVLHTLGQLIGRNRSRTGEAEGLLRQSITLHREVRDKHGEAQVLHTLGQLIGRNRSRTGEAEGLLRQSITLRRELRDKHGEAQVLHTLGQLIGRNRSRTGEAEGLLRQSITLLRELRDKDGEAQVLYTWGKTIARSNREESIRLLRRSLTINQQLNNAYGIELVERELRRMNADPN